MDKIILASSSPRRIEMMKKHGYETMIIPADIDESLDRSIPAKDAVMFLALKKALAVEKDVLSSNPELSGKVLIAADTVVYKDEILGKPLDRENAKRMLKTLSATEHYVSTGVCIMRIGTSNKEVFCDTTKVFCKPLSDEDIEEYLDTPEPYDKAGAYAIQGIFSKHIAGYEGSFNTVVGFPIEIIKEKLDLLK